MRNENMKVVYVYSGKGGVGKSTVCLNLAYALSYIGVKTAVFDADLSGPSIPTMVSKIEEKPLTMNGLSIVPGVYGGLQISSLGFITKPIDGAFWTGKYLEGALYQLVLSVDWDADVLLVDLPPGAGNIHQEMFLRMPGKALIVTTPQEVSYVDIIRGVDFIRRLHVEILGVIENMSYFECGECKTREKIFVGDTKKSLCDPLGIELLAELPINPKVCEYSNKGMPYVYMLPNERCSKRYIKLAENLINQYDIIRKRRRIVPC